MTAKKFFKNPFVIIGIVVLTLAVIGLSSWGIWLGTLTTGRMRIGESSIAFRSPIYIGQDAITAPASGSTKRYVTAEITDKGEIRKNAQVGYRLDREVKGVSLQGNLLTVSSELEKSATLRVIAEDLSKPENERLTISRQIKVIKDNKLKDVPANPLQKEGWTLYYNDEFDGDQLDYSKWSPYYMRYWVDNDERTKANYYFEDSSLVLTCPEDMDSWSSQNSGVKVNGIMSYERNYLHKYGEVGSGAVFNRDVPLFDGIATKYGYFEIRLKMPDTKDGSHFAWWMVGVQGDMNSQPYMQGSDRYMDGHYSNETGEIDIIETTLSSIDGMKKWRPVIHPNGTTTYEYHWLDAYEIPGDPSKEYHVYGFEWDETGTKYYVDNMLAAQSDRSPNYPMMTFLTTYATGGLGKDRGIYPKDAYIDYFRIYKKSGDAQANTVKINGGYAPDEIRIPQGGINSVPLSATVFDQFDNVFIADVKWRLSKTVDGFSPASAAEFSVAGVSISPDGTINVTSEAIEGQDIFVTAYVNDVAKQTKHIRLTNAPSRDSHILFENSILEIKAGESVTLIAALYDQYGEKRADEIWFSLSEDLTARKSVSVAGVSLTREGVLSVSGDAEEQLIVVTAKAGSKYNNLFIKIVR